MKRAIFVGSILLAASTPIHANPWDELPASPPYKSLAETVKARTPPGQQSLLNPTCEGMNGVQCTESAKAVDRSPPMKEEASNEPPPRPKR